MITISSRSSSIKPIKEDERSYYSPEGLKYVLVHDYVYYFVCRMWNTEILEKGGNAWYLY